MDVFFESNFAARTEALDFIDFHILDRIESLISSEPTGALNHLKTQAMNLKSRLEKVNESIFKRLRTDIQSGNLRGKDLVQEIKRFDWNTEARDEAGYDYLDFLFNGIFPVENMPEETKDRGPEMVYYQKTPARIIMELAAKIRASIDDIFYDLGSGLGQVSIWVNLFTGIKTIGVEIEPEFCRHSERSASDMNLGNVEFICADARLLNYSDGNAFYLFTPFRGDILKVVLRILQKKSQKSPIRIFTYGPCTLEVAKENWLICENDRKSEAYRLCEFTSKK